MTQRTAQEPGSVTVQIADGVGSVTFGHPKGNSLPAALLAELAARITALGQEPGARVIVLRSEGAGAFCAGASFAELSAIADVESGTRFFLGFANLINAMRECPKLILARVHGKTVGGGVGMVAASDYALATPAAQVKLSELAVGIGPFVVGPVIERRIGVGNYAALGIDAAEWRSAEWAHGRGLYAELQPDGAALDARARDARRPARGEQSRGDDGDEAGVLAGDRALGGAAGGAGADEWGAGGLRVRATGD